jgi:hypothetical protein
VDAHLRASRELRILAAAEDRHFAVGELATIGSALCGSLPVPVAVLRWPAASWALRTLALSTMPATAVCKACNGGSRSDSTLPFPSGAPVWAASGTVPCVAAASLKVFASETACLSMAMPAALSPAGSRWAALCASR